MKALSLVLCGLLGGGVAFTTAAVQVASVTVSPATPVVLVLRTVQLTATLRDAGGNVLSGRALTWFSDNSGTAQVSALGLVTCTSPGQATITATSEGRSATAMVACLTSDFITMTAQVQTWALLDGLTPSLCENDLLRTGIAGNSGFVVANVSPSAACKAEVAVFASEHAAVLDFNPPFTPGADVVTENLGPAVPLEINLWVVSDAPVSGVGSLLQAVFLETQTLFVDNHVGVELRLPSASGQWVPLTSWTFPPSRLIPTSDARKGTIGDRCTQSGINTLLATPSIYDSGRLNLYVVDLVQGSSAIFEYSCVSGATPPVLTKGESIIYFSRLHHMNASLAHVLGHAFSLIDGGTFPNLVDGHTGAQGLFALAGFDSLNIMWTGLDPNVPGARQKTFSLGQVYRMTLDDRSWLNKFGPRGKMCPNSRLGDKACPALNFGW